MKRPTNEQLDLARAWLNVNEGSGGESEACAIVSQWLAHLQNEQAIAEIARRAHVSRHKARAALNSLTKGE